MIMKMIGRKSRTADIVYKITKEFGVSERTAYRYISSVNKFLKYKKNRLWEIYFTR